jgi:antitoxin HigA-1
VRLRGSQSIDAAVITAAAEEFGVSRRTLSMLLNGHAGISPDMAIRLSKAFGRSPKSWLQLQTATAI